MRLVPLLVLLLLLIPAAPADAACKPGARIERSSAKRVIHTKVVVCVSGRERTVRRGTLRLGNPHRGVLYGDAALVDGKLAIGWVRAARRRSHLTAELRSLASGRVLLRRSSTVRDDDENEELEEPTVEDVPVAPEVELTPRGVLAWSVYSSLYVRSATGRVREIDLVAYPHPLVLEDARTLRAGAVGEADFLDLHPVPVSGGCPVRPGWRTVSERGGLRVTTRRYGARRALRVCVVGSGRDLVAPWPAENEQLTPVGLVGDFLVSTTRRGTTRCSVYVVQLGVQRANAPVPCTQLDAVAPVPGLPLAVTADGAPAWWRDGVLRGARAKDDAILELDRGSVTDLTADGATVRWRRDGVDRAATL